MLENRDFNAECKRLERECSRLQEYFATFEQLKQTIAEHISQSASDPRSQKMVANLNEYLAHDLSRLNEEANGDIKKITLCFKQLEAQLKQCDGQMKNAAATPANPPIEKQQR